MPPPGKPRRSKGEGSISQRTDDAGRPGRWEARVDLGRGPDGRRQRRTVYGATRAEALAKLRALQGQQARGELAYTPRTTVGEYLEHWHATVVVPLREPQTVLQYRSILRARILPVLGHYPLGRLTVAHVQGAVRLWVQPPSGKPGHAPKTVKTTVNVLHVAFQQAISWGLLARNPVDGVHLPRVPRRQARFLQLDDARRLLAVAALPEEPYGPLFALALTTGLRLGELLALRWEDVQGSVLVVQRSRTKVEQGWAEKAPKSDSGVRAIPLQPVHWAILERHRARWGVAEGWMWLSPRGVSLRAYQAERAWGAFRTRHGLPTVTLHELRHSAASLLVSLGVPINVVALILGHHDASVTLRTYSHVMQGSTEGAMAQLDALLRGLDED